MKKIPTLFKRDPDDMRRVLPEVNPGCEWVLAGEGVATRKFDGTCVMFDGTEWWTRREVKPGAAEPEGWVEVDVDEATGKRVGWSPCGQSGFYRWLVEAVGDTTWPSGTYELCGPKINGNPEQIGTHILYPHGVQVWAEGVIPADYLGLRGLLGDPDSPFPKHFEGIVWHHRDGRMAKLKRRDFPEVSR